MEHPNIQLKASTEWTEIAGYPTLFAIFISGNAKRTRIATDKIVWVFIQTKFYFVTSL